MDRAEISLKIEEIVRKQRSIAAEQVDPDIPLETLGFDSLDARPRRPHLAPIEESFERGRVAFDLDVDRSVRLVAGETGQTETERLVLRALPEIDALDMAVDADRQMALHRSSFSCSAQS